MLPLLYSELLGILQLTEVKKISKKGSCLRFQSVKFCFESSPESSGNVFYRSSNFWLQQYDVTLTWNPRFVHSWMQFRLKCVQYVHFHSLYSLYCSFVWLIIWSHVTYLTLRMTFFPKLVFYCNWRRWRQLVYVTLGEGYLGKFNRNKT